MPMAYFIELEQITQNFIWNHKRPQIATATLRKKNKDGGIMLHDLKLYYMATLIKSMVLAKRKDTHRSMEQNRETRSKSMPMWSINI